MRTSPFDHFAAPSRRSLVKAAAWALAAPLVAAFASLVSRHDRLARRPRRVTIPASPADEVTFVDEVVVCRGAGGLKAFSARCTHLGCRIDHLANGLLVCPCHGSRFHVDGTVALGPASRPLEALPIEIDPKTGEMAVRVS